MVLKLKTASINMIPDDANDVVPDLRSLGPTVLERFVGQQQVVDQVRVGLEASWNDTTPFPHTLMVGPPGVGKMQMAKIIAASMGSPLHDALSNTLRREA
jgi:Holliday junction resolvasome RuvABC ATP-dependent DNA helicase subunit